MPELTLKKHEIECLTVKIGDSAYNIPLGNSLKFKELKKLSDNDEIIKFFEKYLGAEVMDELTAGDLKAIIEAWSDATQKASGAKMGEL